MLAVLAAILPSCGALRSPAARVGGREITDDQIAHDSRILTALASIAQQTCVPPIPREDAATSCNRATLASLIRDGVIADYARANGLEADPAEVDSIVADLQDSFGGADVLAGAGVTEADLRTFAVRFALRRAVGESVGAEAVSAEDVRAIYDRDILQFTVIHAEHILLPTEQLADEVYAIASVPRFSEEDFLALAGERSIDPNAATDSGDLGELPATGLDAAFVGAALALEPGQVSLPVQTQYGWHVIRLVSKNTTPFERLQADLERQARSDAFDAWLADRLHDADVEVNPKYGRWDPDNAVISTISSTARGEPAPSPAPS